MDNQTTFVKIKSEDSLMGLKKPIKIYINKEYRRNLQVPEDEFTVSNNDEVRLKLDRITGSKPLDTSGNHRFVVSYNKRFKVGMILSSIFFTLLALLSAYEFGYQTKLISTIILIVMSVLLLASITLWRNHWILVRKVSF